MWLEPCAGLGRHREAALALQEGLRLENPWSHAHVAGTLCRAGAAPGGRAGAAGGPPPGEPLVARSCGWNPVQGWGGTRRPRWRCRRACAWKTLGRTLMWLEPCAGLGRHREAALALEEGLRLDPFDWPLKQALEAATQGILRDLVEGFLPIAFLM